MSNEFTELNTLSNDNPFLVDYDPEGDLLPEGLHIAAFIAVESKSSAAGNPMLVLQFEIHEDTDFTGSKLWLNLLLTPSHAWRRKPVFAALGLIPGKGIDIREAVGKLVKLDIQHEDWEGTTRPRIKKVLPHTGSIDATPMGFELGVVPGVKDVDSDIPF